MRLSHCLLGRLTQTDATYRTRNGNATNALFLRPTDADRRFLTHLPYSSHARALHRLWRVTTTSVRKRQSASVFENRGGFQ